MLATLEESVPIPAPNLRPRQPFYFNIGSMKLRFISCFQSWPHCLLHSVRLSHCIGYASIKIALSSAPFVVCCSGGFPGSDGFTQREWSRLSLVRTWPFHI